MALRLRTVGPDGGNPSPEMAFRRSIWYPLGILPYVGGLGEVAAVIYVAVTIDTVYEMEDGALAPVTSEEKIPVPADSYRLA